MVRSEVVEALLYGCATWTPLKGPYTKLRTTHRRMLLQILGGWCKSPNKRILSYKDALQRTKCESIETTMRTRRLLWSGTLLRMGDHRLPTCREGWRTRGNVGRGGRRKNGRTAWQRTFGYLASRGTRTLPHLNLEPGIAQYVPGAVGLWPRG